jgi:hypothetical protein
MTTASARVCSTAMGVALASLGLTRQAGGTGVG